MAVSRRGCFMWILILLLLTGNAENCNDASAPTKRNKFSIGHLNICGLLGKIDQLSFFVTKHNFNIFGVTETLMKDSLPTELINIPCFNFERKDRAGAGAGVCKVTYNNKNKNLMYIVSRIL
jgi:hypothetical protein